MYETQQQILEPYHTIICIYNFNFIASCLKSAWIVSLGTQNISLFQFNIYYKIINWTQQRKDFTYW